MLHLFAFFVTKPIVFGIFQPETVENFTGARHLC